VDEQYIFKSSPPNFEIKIYRHMIIDNVTSKSLYLYSLALSLFSMTMTESSFGSNGSTEIQKRNCQRGVMTAAHPVAVVI